MKKILFFALAAMVAFASCSPEPANTGDEGIVDPDLSFDVINKPVTVGFEAGHEVSISVRGNVAWAAGITEGTGATLTPGSESGDGNGTVTAVFEGNEDEESRQVKITVSTTAAVAVKSFGVTITQKGKVELPKEYYVRVSRDLDDWAGEYFLVYEGQGNFGSGNYTSTTVLAFDGSGGGTDTAPLDGAGNVFPLSPLKPATNPDLSDIEATVERTATDVTVKGGKILLTEANAKCALTVELVRKADGVNWYSIKTKNGYYIGGGGAAGTLSASQTFTEPAHLHKFAIGDATAAGSAGVTFHNSAVIASASTASVNNTVRVNSNTGRFGYWGPALQMHVALYKRGLEPNDPEPPAFTFSVNTNPLTAGYEAGSSVNIPVSGNAAWTAQVTEGTGATIEAGTGSGDGVGTVKVVFAANDSYDANLVKVKVSTEADVPVRSYEVAITQSGKPEPTSVVYARVDAAPIDWSGQYLIVFEDAVTGTFGYKAVYNGALDGTNTTVVGLDGTKNALDITIADGKISASTAVQAAAFTIASVTGGYSIKSASGFYIGCAGSNTTTPNATFDPAVHTNTIEFGTDRGVEKCVIIKGVADATRCLRINAQAASRRFCYFQSTGNQEPVALYKLVED